MPILEQDKSVASTTRTLSIQLKAETIKKIVGGYVSTNIEVEVIEAVKNAQCHQEPDSNGTEITNL